MGIGKYSFVGIGFDLLRSQCRLVRIPGPIGMLDYIILMQAELQQRHKFHKIRSFEESSKEHNKVAVKLVNFRPQKLTKIIHCLGIMQQPSLAKDALVKHPVWI